MTGNFDTRALRTALRFLMTVAVALVVAVPALAQETTGTIRAASSTRRASPFPASTVTVTGPQGAKTAVDRHARAASTFRS